MMNDDENIDLELRESSTSLPLNRRQFLQRLGGGIIIFFSIGDAAVSRQRQSRRPDQEVPADFNAFLQIGADERVTCLVGKIEMGQGIITSLAQMLADELDVAFDSVDMTMGDTDLCPYDMGTFGSRTTRYLGPVLRAAAAEARTILLQLAAEQLKTSVDQLQVRNGVVFDQTRAKKITYGQLTRGKIIERHLQEKPGLKDVSQFTIVGQPHLRTDALEKVTGAARFAGDIHLPGMLYAKIARPPAHGARLTQVNTTAAEKMEGVQVVRDGDLIAVLHQYPDVAEQALTQVQAQFVVPDAQVDDRSIFDHLLNVAGAGNIIAEGGDLATGTALASEIVEATYLNSYVAHAPLEPHTAVARIEGNRATVWASTQAPFRLKDQVAEALGFAPENVRIITPFVGGGFGGKTRGQQALEAARLAQLTGKPVQVAWSRAEEFFYDTFRPAAIVKIKSGIDTAGKIVFWDYNVYYAGDRGSAQFYAIPHHRTVSSGGGGWSGTPGSHPFATGAWRAPASNTNSFARESHIDMLANKAGMDPLEFRLKNLDNTRMQRLLTAAADKFGWTPAKTPSGRGYGIACADYLDTYVAAIAEVTVDKNRGNVQVQRVVCAQDLGLVVNPAGAKIQIEGCVTMGLGYALSEEIRFKGGEILDLNFDTYEIPKFSWLPEIETVLIDAKENPPTGCGEPAIVCMGGVIANAIYDAIGVRLLQLPMTAERIRAAG